MKKLNLMTFITGANRVNQMENDWVEAERFFPEQMGAYGYDPMMAMCAMADAGITISMMTDAKCIEFECKMKQAVGDATLDYGQQNTESNNDSQEDFFLIIGSSFNVLIDGELYISIPWIEGLIKVDMPESNGKKRKVQILFPYLRASAIRNLQIDGTVAEPLSFKGNILCLGDSITHGANCKLSSSTWVWQLAESKNLQLFNQGVCGYIFQKGSICKLNQGTHEFDTIIVAYGTNDWSFLSDRELMVGNMTEYFRELIGMFPKTRIYVMTPIARLDDTVNECISFDDWRACIEDTVSQYENVTVIPGNEMLDADVKLFQDGTVHPNEDGARQMMERLKERIL